MAVRNPTHAEHQRRLEAIAANNPDALSWDGPRKKEMDANTTGAPLGDPRRCRVKTCVSLLDPWLVEQGIRIHQACEFPELFPRRTRR